MLQKIATYNPSGKKIVAIEYSERDAQTTILGVEIIQKRGELDISEKFSVHDISDIPEGIKNARETHLIVTDTNVLTKQLASTGTDMEILSEAYPNVNLDEFYYQILKANFNSYVAICRKEYIDRIIELFQKEQVRIIEVSLGNLAIAGITPFVNNAVLHSFSSTIEITNQEVVSIRSGAIMQEEYEIESLRVPSAQLLSLSAILASFGEGISITGNIGDRNQQLKEDQKQALLFKKMLQYGIGFLLLALLINFFVFNSSYANWQQLQEELQVYTTQKERIEKQQSIVSAKESSVQSILTTGFSRSSYFLDQVVQQMPETILLTEFIYQPTAKTIRKDKPIILQNKTVLVSGDSTDKSSFTAWLHTIETMDFVEQVTILQYGADTKGSTNFEIKIILGDDTAQ